MMRETLTWTQARLGVVLIRPWYRRDERLEWSQHRLALAHTMVGALYVRASRRYTKCNRVFTTAVLF